MTTAASWTCDSCLAVNTAKQVTCTKCGTRRVVDLTQGTTGTTSTTKPTTARRPTTKRPTAPPPTVFTPGGGTSVGVQLSRQTTTGPAKSHPIDHGVTRYLCCAMQLDAGLARRAIEQIVEEPRRAVACSPGVDLSCVLAYALAARHRQLVRDCLLALLLILIVAGAFVSGIVVLLGLLLAWGLVAGELFHVTYGVLVPKLARGVFDPAAAPKPTSAHQAARLDEVKHWDSGNVTVFQRFAPFAGYGGPVESWSFAVRADVPKEGARAVRPFAVDALYDHVATAVEKLRLPGVRVQDRLFVSGDDLRVHLDDTTRRALLPDEWSAPVSRVSPKLIRDLRNDADASARARPYLALQTSGWQGEIVSTQFMRFALLPEKDLLFVESSICLLAPVREHYRSVDTTLDRPTFRQAGEIITSSVARTIGLLLSSIPTVFAVIGHSFGLKDSRQRREIRERRFNYGAPVSIREAASDQQYHRYYQKIDREMYAKVVSRRVLDSVVEFLDRHDIDTSDLRERQTTIYNNGLYVGANAKVSVVQSAVAAGRNAVGRVFAEAGARIGGGAERK